MRMLRILAMVLGGAAALVGVLFAFLQTPVLAQNVFAF